MKRLKEINLEVGMPMSADALKLLKSSIALFTVMAVAEGAES